jgi:hypothetical protein
VCHHSQQAFERALRAATAERRVIGLTNVSSNGISVDNIHH